MAGNEWESGHKIKLKTFIVFETNSRLAQFEDKRRREWNQWKDWVLNAKSDSEMSAKQTQFWKIFDCTSEKMGESWVPSQNFLSNTKKYF